MKFITKKIIVLFYTLVILYSTNINSLKSFKYSNVNGNIKVNINIQQSSKETSPISESNTKINIKKSGPLKKANELCTFDADCETDYCEGGVLKFCRGKILAICKPLIIKGEDLACAKKWEEQFNIDEFVIVDTYTVQRMALSCIQNRCLPNEQNINDLGNIINTNNCRRTDYNAWKKVWNEQLYTDKPDPNVKCAFTKKMPCTKDIQCERKCIITPNFYKLFFELNIESKLGYCD